MYFLDGLGWNSFTDYRFHYYGTYSEALATEVQSMVGNGLLRETVSGDLHSYVIPYDRQNIANNLIAKLRSTNETRYQNSVKLVRTLEGYSTDMLEVTSTLVYLRKLKPQLDDHSLIGVAKELKPQFDDDKFKKGLKIFEVLKGIKS